MTVDPSRAHDDAESATAQRQVASLVRQRWAQGETADAPGALAEHPELLADKSVVLELAYEEYCQHAEAGNAPPVDDFCARFPAFRTSLGRLLQAHLLVADNAPLLAANTPVPWPEPGSQVGDLTILRELGRGAFARVFLAHESSTDRAVVVKFSRETGLEARTLGRLAHDNIVPVLSAAVEPTTGLATLRMPFLGAATLNDLIRLAWPESGSAPRSAKIIVEAAQSARRAGDPVVANCNVDPTLSRCSYVDGIVRLGMQLLQALAFLHERGVVHGDLKPSNVLIGEDGRPRLLDFNLATQGTALPGRVGGTIPYMAPEQLKAILDAANNQGGCPQQADLFAWGVIFFELLTGKAPFGQLQPGDSTHDAARELLARHERGHTGIRRLNPRVPASIAVLVERCLAQEAEQRPNATQALAELTSYVRRQRLRTRRLWLAATVLVFVGLLASLPFASRGAAAIAESRGRTAYAAGRFGEAADAFRWALTLHSGNARVRRCFALTLIRDSESMATQPAEEALTLAIDALSTAAGTDPTGDDCMCLGYCFSRLKQHQHALNWYERAEKKDVQSAALFNNRAFSYARMHDYDRALLALDRASLIDSEQPSVYYNRAEALTRNQMKGGRDDLWRAQSNVERALQLGCQSSDLYVLAAKLAVVLDGQPGHPRALGYLRDAIIHGADRTNINKDVIIVQAFRGDESLEHVLRLPQYSNPNNDSHLILPLSTLPN